MQSLEANAYIVILHHLLDEIYAISQWDPDPSLGPV